LEPNCTAFMMRPRLLRTCSTLVTPAFAHVQAIGSDWASLRPPKFELCGERAGIVEEQLHFDLVFHGPHRFIDAQLVFVKAAAIGGREIVSPRARMAFAHVACGEGIPSIVASGVVRLNVAFGDLPILWQGRPPPPVRCSPPVLAGDRNTHYNYLR
jgi:hypothetical protein